MVRSMWLPVTSGVATVCVGLTLWPSVASPADGLSIFGAAADARTLLERLPLLGRSSSSFSGWSPPVEHQDLRVANVSVHRVRYERNEDTSSATTADQDPHVQEAEETLVRSLFGSAWAAVARKARFSGSGDAPSTSVVVTWEDHPLAAATRPDAEAMCSATEDTECVPSEEPSKETGRSVVYEAQVWVNGWGLDAFWHPANRKLTTRDPFVVLHGLPHEKEELAVRVRMKVQTRARLLAGLWFLTSDADGPWSDVVTLSPIAEPALETLVAFFSSHQFLGGVLALLVGISVLVILRLAVASVFPRKRTKSETKRSPVESVEDADDEAETESVAHETEGRKTVRVHRHPHHVHLPVLHRRRRVSSTDLEQEVADLRQELADSEAEVRRLMLFRGYGIDELRENELEELETELRRTLKLVQKRRRLPHFDSLEETEDEEEDEGENEPAAQGLSNGKLGTVMEEDAA